MKLHTFNSAHAAFHKSLVLEEKEISCYQRITIGVNTIRKKETL